MSATRRGALLGGLALAACDRRAGAAPASSASDAAALFSTAAGRAPGWSDAVDPAAAGPLPRLRDLAPFPLGNEVISQSLSDPVYAELARTQFNQLSIGYEAKMEAVVQADGSLAYDGADKIADFCRANGLGLMGAALIWYVFSPAPFERLAGDPVAFGQAYDGFLRGVIGRYRGRARGWDVVNEPLTYDGTTLRDSLWSRVLGPEQYMVRAFQVAREADPQAVLFLNETGQETRPAKLDTLMRLVDRLLKAGAPITGLGAQLHVDIDIAPGDMARCLKTMAGFGLPIHVSEFDCTLQSDRKIDLRSRTDKLALQRRIYAEALDAFYALPKRQQFAFTIFGLRDKDSWLRVPPNAGDGTDEPLLFDDVGRPKPVFWTVAQTLRDLRADGVRPA